MVNNQISPTVKSRRRKITVLLVGLLFLVMIAYYAWPGAVPGNRSPIQLVVYAYSTQKEVFTEGIFPAFTKNWESTAETDLLITGVFGPSGTLAGQISLGAPADIVVFSSVNYLNYLVISREVSKDIQPRYFGASPIVIVTRPGNPNGIKNYSDLAQADVVLIHSDPRSSGAGELSLLAEYGSWYLNTKDQSAALEQVREIWNNVRLVAPSARASLILFEFGAGDALITYEQDARLAQDRGVELEIVIPSPTLLSQPVALAVESNISRAEQAAAEAFLEFLVSSEAQEIFSDYYLRPISPKLLDRFPAVKTFTSSDLGGWSTAFSQLVEPFWEREILPNLALQEGYTIYTTENK
jgi:ABC-type sulfate transport system substrate-binding protein